MGCTTSNIPIHHPFPEPLHSPPADLSKLKEDEIKTQLKQILLRTPTLTSPFEPYGRLNFSDEQSQRNDNLHRYTVGMVTFSLHSDVLILNRYTSFMQELWIWRFISWFIDGQCLAVRASTSQLDTRRGAARWKSAHSIFPEQRQIFADSKD